MEIVALLLLISNTIQESQYKFEISYANGTVPENGVYLINKGAYTKFKGKIYMEGEQKYSEIDAQISILGDNDEEFSIVSDVFDTFRNRIFYFYIGVPCLSSTDNQEYTITLGVNGTYEYNFVDYDIKVKVKSDINEIKFLDGSSVSKGTYNLFRTANQVYNVDKLSFSFTNEECSKSNECGIDNKKFKEFADERSTDDEINSFRLFLKEDASIEKESLEFKVNTDNKCFRSDNIKFSVDNKKIPVFTKYDKEETLKQISVIYPTIPNQMMININLQRFPALVTCVAIKHKSKLLSDEDLRNPEKWPSEQFNDAKVVQKLWHESGSGFIIFQDMDRLGNYKAKCLVDAATEDKAKMTSYSFIIGESSEADLKIPLMKEDNEPIYARAINYDLSTASIIDDKDIANFREKMIKTCNEYIFNKMNEAKKSWEEYGCVFCKANYIEEYPKMLSMGFVSETNCPYDFEDDSLKYFPSILVEIGKRKEEIFGDFNVADYETDLERDDMSPNKSLIKAEIITNTEQNVSIRVTNDNNQMVTCHIKKDIEYMDSIGLDTSDIYSNDASIKVVLKMKKSKEISINMKNDVGYSNMIQNINMFCYYIPGGYYHSHETEVFSPVSFYDINPKDKEKDYDSKIPLNCTKQWWKEESLFKAECIDWTNHKRPDLLSTDPRRIADTYNRLYFDHLNNVDQLSYIKYYEDNYQNPDINFVEFYINFMEALSLRKCKTNKNYEKCRSIKIAQFEKGFKQFREIYSSYDQIKTILTEQSLGSNPKKVINEYAQALFFITNNADLISNKEMLDSIFKFIEESIDAFTYLTKLMKDYSAEDKVDIIRLFTASSINLNDAMMYAEVDNLVENKENKSILKTEYDIRQRAMTEKAAKLMFNITKYNTFYYENFAYIQLDKESEEPVKSTNTNIRKLYDEPERKIEFKIGGVNAFFRKQSIFNSVKNSRYLHLFAYKRFPFLSIRNENYQDEFIGARIYDKYSTEIKNAKLSGKNRITVSFLVDDEINETKHNYCLTYDENSDKISDKNVETTTFKSAVSGREYIDCKLSGFTDVTLGKGSKKSKNNFIAYILIGLGIIVLIVIAIVIIFKIRSGKEDYMNMKGTGKLINE